MTIKVVEVLNICTHITSNSLSLGYTNKIKISLLKVDKITMTCKKL